MFMKTNDKDRKSLISRKRGADLFPTVCGISHPVGRTADLERQVCATDTKTRGTKPECL